MIRVSVESRRGCGYRKPGGLYLVADGVWRACGLMPIPLEHCPTCGGGIHSSRGWTWVDGDALVEGRECLMPSHCCRGCSMALRPIGRVGLLWVGVEAYPTPADFLAEANLLGVSRRIGAVPRGFVPGRTMVWLAHARAVTVEGDRHVPAVFAAFRPRAVEYVVRGDETPEELEALASRGIQLVNVIRDNDPDLAGAEEDI